MVLEEVTAFINKTSSDMYLGVSEQLPEQYRILVILATYTLLIVIYGIFIWKFYRFLARRNIIDFNLRQYNRTEHPLLNKLIASVLFLLEYIIIMPFLVFFWFSILAIFLLILSKTQDVNQILLISASIVAATRLSAYFSQDLSKDLAKLFPFTVLAVFLLQPEFFSIAGRLARIVEIPSLINHILAYLVFIFVIEVIMRTLFTIVDLIKSEEEAAEKQESG